MKLSSILVLFLLLSLPIALTQGADEKGTQGGDKHTLKSVSCDPACGFMIQSHDEKELCAIVIEHAKTHHNKMVTEKDVRGMMKSEHVIKTGKSKK